MRKAIILLLPFFALMSCNRHIAKNQNMEQESFTNKLFYSISENKAKENFVFSPLSLETDLALCATGTAGRTAQEFYSLLGFNSSGKADSSYSSLSRTLPSADTSVVFSIANSIWADSEVQLLPDYVGRAQEYYDAAARSLDFASGRAAEEVNSWIEDKTRGLVRNVLSEPVEADLLLVNALYFKGEWQWRMTEFPKPQAFYGISGVGEEVYLTLKKPLPYFENADFKAVSLPYGNGNYSFIVLLPNEGCYEKVSKALPNPGTLLGTMDDKIDVKLALPKMEMECSLALKPYLQQLGLSDAFGKEADFSRMSLQSLRLTEVLQKSRIIVNELGTEAASSTIAMVGLTAMPRPAPVREFRADRPYIYMIYEKSSNTVLFIGQKVK